MSESLTKPEAKGSRFLRNFPFLIIIMAAFSQFGCTYRFTNDHIVRPEGIRTIAIEAIWDTSREVIPHELLWASLQEAFAADGRLRLVPQAEADALVRAHVVAATISPAGSEIKNNVTDDPEVFNREVPATPRSFKLLTQAGEIKDAGALATTVEVEVWSLRTRTLLMRQSYSLATNFRAVHADDRATVTTRANDYLRYEEAVEAKYHALAKNIGAQVVRDLLVR